MKSLLMLLTLCVPLVAAPAGLRLPNTFQQIAAPTNIPSLSLWLDASQITGLVGGDAVATWSDASGNGNDVSQATGGNRPTYQTNAFNGLPAVRFDGTNDILTNKFSTFSDGLSAASIFVVMRPFTASPNQYWFFNNGRMSLQQLSGTAYIYGTNGAYGSSANTSTDRQLRVGVFDGSLSGNSERLKYWHNNQQKTLTFTGTIPATWGSATGYNVGSLSAGSVPANGDIAEILFYSRALSDHERTQVRGYLNSKYSLY